MEFKQYLEKLMAHKDLTFDEASSLCGLFLEGVLEDIQMAALLVALKMKGESISEIAGFGAMMRSKALDMSMPGVDVIDNCGTGGDCSHSFNISTVSALIAAGAGCKIAKHGNRSVSSLCGSADVLQALGIKIQEEPEKIKEGIRTIGIGFLYAPNMHSAMKYVMSVRKSLATRTLFNILGPLINPARVRKQIIGVYEAKLCELYVRVLKEMGHEEAYVVHGRDGLDEVSLSDSTLVYHLRHGEIRNFEVTPEQFGLKRVPRDVLKGGDAEENARIIKDILDGKPGPRREIACMNAAFSIHLCGKSATLQTAYPLACESIDSGRAKKILAQWKALSV